MTDAPGRPLAALLDLTPSGEDRWFAPTPGEGPRRLFGGQVAAQALAAACKTVDADRPPHSMHGYFIRPGRPDTVLELIVERTRDGRSFTTRHVTAVQEGNAIFNLTASFHAGEEGTDWQLPGPRLELPSEDERAPGPGRPFLFWVTNPFEIRPVAPAIDNPFPTHPCWVRLREEVPTDQATQLCALTFISDMGLVAAARAPHDRSPASLASLDHAVWFHRPVDLSQWHLFSADPVSNFGARGLARGTIHAADGRLVASIAQEALLRAGRPDWMPERS
jgi:acyl-CoA thioesterase II